MTVETSTSLSMIKAQGLPVICFMIVAGGIGIWQGRQYGRCWPFLAGLSAVIILVGTAYSSRIIYRDRNHIVEVDAKYAEFMLRAPGLIGSVVYAAYVLSHQKDIVALPHTHVPKEITGHNGEKRRNIIFIAGESGFVGRYSAYGYTGSTTTPYAQYLKDNHALCIINYVHSTANVTHEAMPTLLSFYGPGRKEALYSEKNLVELAKDQGYHTYWIGAQEGRGIYARSYGYISEFSDYTVRPDYSSDKKMTQEDDNTLIPLFNKKSSDPYKYKLFIIHLQGSHIDYVDNYDKEDKIALPQSDDYDRTVHKTDRIIKKIIEKAKEKLGDFDLIYIPDHGEIVGKGHGLQYGGYDQYKVPLYVANLHNNCNNIEKLRSNDGYINDLSVRTFLLEMMGYTVSHAYLDQLHQTDSIIHSDGHVYSYDQLPR